MKRRRKPVTPNSQIRSALRQLWLRSRERSQALKDAGYRCQMCGVKQSAAKGREVRLEVHHPEGIGNWQAVIEMVREQLLCEHGRLEVVCPTCHSAKHQREREENEK